MLSTLEKESEKDSEKGPARENSHQPQRPHLRKRDLQRHLAQSAVVDIGAKIAGSIRIARVAKVVAKVLPRALAKERTQTPSCAFVAEDKDIWQTTARYQSIALATKTKMEMAFAKIDSSFLHLNAHAPRSASV